jgi:probable rRNA maturation factor
MPRLATVDIKKTIRGTLPRIPFERLAKAILGNAYELSVVVCADSLAQRMNEQYRQKTYRPNVLSFPLTKHEGEIFLNIRKAEREAHAMGISTRERIAHLFVHGCFHLKGLPHGRTMDTNEDRVLRRFGLR